MAPGYQPARIQVALTPFDLDTLEHFIFLERPETAPVGDAPAFRIPDASPRRPETGVLMPSAPDYATIGEFYELLVQGFDELAGRLGEAGLFIGPADYQLRAEEMGAAELSVVCDLATARRALHLIVVQGEGAPGHGESSHFEQFLHIQREYRALLDKRPSFCPSRPVARNPVMRVPQAEDRVHVTGRAAAPVLDAANAVYSLLLRCLVETYNTPIGSTRRRGALLGGAIGLMKVLAGLSGVLTTLPASDEAPDIHAGVTFAMLRSTEGFALGVDAAAMLRPRFDDLRRQLPRLDLPIAVQDRLLTILKDLGESLIESGRRQAGGQ